jgi:hypothetical protein
LGGSLGGGLGSLGGLVGGFSGLSGGATGLGGGGGSFWDRLVGMLGGYTEAGKPDYLRTIIGAGVPLLGQLFAPKAKEFNPYESSLYQDVLNRVRTGAQQPLTQEQKDAITRNYDDQLKVAKENLTAQYKALRPGFDIESDSSYRGAISDLEEKYGQLKSDALNKAQMELTSLQNAQLSDLAAMDVYSLAQKAQISLEEARQFQQNLWQLMGTIWGGGRGSNLGFYLPNIFGWR